MAEAVEPRRVRLKLKNAPVAEALAALRKQSALPVQYAPPTGPGATPPRPVSLELDGVPAWEALDRFCRSAGLVYTASPGGRVLRAGKLPQPGAVSYAGPFRLEAQSWSYSRGLTLGPGAVPQESLSLSVALLAEPGTDVLAISSPRALEARDDKGAALTARPTPPAFARWRGD